MGVRVLCPLPLRLLCSAERVDALVIMAVRQLPKGAAMSVDDAIASLRRHAQTGRPTGAFLQAVLENDLMSAVGHADESSLDHLQEIVAFVHWDMPASCWGSRVKVAAWQAARRAEREAEA